MVEFLGIRPVAVKNLYLPGDFALRLKEPRVKELAASIDALDGCIHEPVVRKSDGLLISGQDRTAAHFYLKREIMLVKLVECTDEEVEKIRVDENYHRRHSTEERQSLYEKALENATRISPFILRTGKKGRPKKPETIAREETAMRLNVSPETIRKQQQRQRKKRSTEEEPVRDLGMAIDAGWRLKVAEAKTVLENDARALRALKDATIRLLASDAAIQKPRVQRLLEALTEASDIADGLVPSCLCPACKGLTGVQENCTMCLTAGYIGKSQEPGVLEELWEADKLLVDGKVVPMTDYAVDVGNDVDTGETGWGV